MHVHYNCLTSHLTKLGNVNVGDMIDHLESRVSNNALRTVRRFYMIILQLTCHLQTCVISAGTGYYPFCALQGTFHIANCLPFFCPG